MTDLIEEQLFELQKACNRYKHTDPKADWVLFAVSRYIYSGRANNDFLSDFIKTPAQSFIPIIKKCLNGDVSDIAIIKKFRNCIR